MFEHTNREWSAQGIPLLPVICVAEDGRLVKGEAKVKENELEKEMEQAKLSSNDAGGFAAGGETPLPSPERQAAIEAPFEDIFTCFFHAMPPWFLLCCGYILVFGSCSMLGPDPKTG